MLNYVKRIGTPNTRYMVFIFDFDPNLGLFVDYC